MYLYSINETGTSFFKLGYSENPTRRLKELQTGNHRKLVMVERIRGDKAYEVKLHRYYADQRVYTGGGSEWFDFNGKIPPSLKKFQRDVPEFEWMDEEIEPEIETLKPVIKRNKSLGKDGRPTAENYADYPSYLSKEYRHHQPKELQMKLYGEYISSEVENKVETKKGFFNSLFK